MQKDLEVAKFLCPNVPSTKSRTSNSDKVSVGRKKFMLREKLTESGKLSQSVKDATASEQSDAIHEEEEHLPARIPPRQGKSAR